MNTHPTAGATEERQDDVRRAAGGSRRSPDNEARSQSVLTRVNTEEITIRPEYPDDELALNRLATLDSAHAPPARPLLLAEVDGELRAAVSLRDGKAIADPFHPTAATVALLRAHARQTATAEPRRAVFRAIRAGARVIRTGRRTPAWAR